MSQKLLHLPQGLALKRQLLYLYKAITITEDGGYEDLVVDFTATNTINATFNIISTSANKVTASNSTVSYDGTVVGTIAKTG
jgi:hypothetical protein